METDKHMSMSDPAIIAEMQSASVDEAHRAHDAARRFITRNTFDTYTVRGAITWKCHRIRRGCLSGSS